MRLDCIHERPDRLLDGLREAVPQREKAARVVGELVRSRRKQWGLCGGGDLAARCHGLTAVRQGRGDGTGCKISPLAALRLGVTATRPDLTQSCKSFVFKVFRFDSPRLHHYLTTGPLSGADGATAGRPAAFASFRAVGQGLAGTATHRSGTGRRDVSATSGPADALFALSFSDSSGLRAPRPAIESLGLARTYGSARPAGFDVRPE